MATQQDVLPPTPPEPDELALLLEALQSERSSRRRRAVRHLARLAPEQLEPAIGPLVAAFRDTDLTVRSGAVALLVRLGATAVPALMEALRQDDPDVRKVAVVTLGEIGPPAAAARDLLTEALADDWLAVAAQKALEKIQGRRERRSRLRRLAPWLLLGWAWPWRRCPGPPGCGRARPARPRWRRGRPWAAWAPCWGW
jgi:HEAT repeat protein